MKERASIAVFQLDVNSKLHVNSKAEAISLAYKKS
jgi:hypothetical protein